MMNNQQQQDTWSKQIIQSQGVFGVHVSVCGLMRYLYTHTVMPCTGLYINTFIICLLHSGLRCDSHLCEDKLFKETASPKGKRAASAVPCGHNFSLLYLVTFSCNGAGCFEEEALKARWQQAVIPEQCIHMQGGLLLSHWSYSWVLALTDSQRNI